MIRPVNTPVAVGLALADGTCHPRWVRWGRKTYRVEEIGFYHAFRKGTKRIHVFSVNVGTLDMRVEIDGETFTASTTVAAPGECSPNRGIRWACRLTATPHRPCG